MSSRNKQKEHKKTITLEPIEISDTGKSNCSVLFEIDPQHQDALRNHIQSKSGLSINICL